MDTQGKQVYVPSHTPAGTQRTTPEHAVYTLYLPRLAPAQTHACVIRFIPTKAWQENKRELTAINPVLAHRHVLFCSKWTPHQKPQEYTFTEYSLSAEWWQISERERSWVGLWSRLREESKYVAVLCHINRGRNEADHQGRRRKKENDQRFLFFKWSDPQYVMVTDFPNKYWL